jgi:transcriptional regulator with XRE-family HTH domain
MSYRLSIDPKNRKVSRFLGRVRREIQKAFEEEKSARGLTQAEIARILGTDRSVINRQLLGTENLTLKRVGEFAWVLGRELDFSLIKPSLPTGSNIQLDRAVPKATSLCQQREYIDFGSTPPGENVQNNVILAI